ncbi:hypothetical protein EC988_008039 [Linderina pennispora]|nr:hypothetical protein EC988_008039 [Linderina pennispora]
MILYSILASSITWADQSKTIMVIESLAPTISNMMHNSHSPKLTHKLHDIMVRLVVARPNFDPDVFIQQQRLLQHQPSSAESGSGHYDQSMGTRKSLNAAITSAGSSSTQATVGASTLNVTSPISPTMMQSSSHRASHAPPTRGRDDSGDRLISRITDESSVLSAQSSSPSLAVPETTFDRSIMPAHREYLAEIGFSGLGRAILFETNMNHWRELAELTSLLVDHIL